MDPHEQKRRQVERYRRAMDKHVGHEEEKRRKSASRERKGAQRERGTRRHEWSDGAGGWDDEQAFERIERRTDRAEPVRGATTKRAFDETLPRATVVAVHRGQAELEGGRRARFAPHLAADPEFSIAVGDEAAFTDREGVLRVEGVAPRRSRLARTDPGRPGRELVIAANVDVAVIVAAAVDPPLRPGLIDRFLLGLERGGVAALVCVNKADLVDEGRRAELDALVAPYADVGVDVVWCSAAARQGLDELRARLAGRTCVFVGHSGVGKSSLLNALDPVGGRATGDVRELDGRGRHTTTSSSLRDLGGGTRVIDTPGVRAFGLEHLTLADVRAGFPDLAAFASGCRFEDCTHVHEPGCAVAAAAEEGRVAAARLESYRRVLGEL